MHQEKTFAERVIDYNEQLRFTEPLPEGFKVMNPFLKNPEGLTAMKQFYRKYYNDYHQRKLILGINPGRFGAGITGIPFTDTKHLVSECGINFQGTKTHEPSATFVYKMINAYGGTTSFYHDIYIHSLFPLAIIRKNNKGNFVNCNYYDDKLLIQLLRPFMLRHLSSQLEMDVDTEVAYVLGKKNAVFVEKINKEGGFFKRLEVFEHPRYIQQYKSKEALAYANKFVNVLKESS